jgi:hypothetical protein
MKTTELTAVEWLVEEFDLKMQDNFFMTKIQQAKEMEKEQKIEFACQVYDKYNFGTQEISFREECEQFKQQEQ